MTERHQKIIIGLGGAVAVLLALSVFVSSVYAEAPTVYASAVQYLDPETDYLEIQVIENIKNGIYPIRIVAVEPKEPEPISFANVTHADADKIKGEADKALSFICEWNTYLDNFKLQQGCIRNQDGTWSAP